MIFEEEIVIKWATIFIKILWIKSPTI